MSKADMLQDVVFGHECQEILRKSDSGLPSSDVILDNYIDYWDRVISNWMSYKTNLEEKMFIESLNFSGKCALLEDYMPEPYWGNPHNCSIVVVNYNPAGDDGEDSFTWRKFANCNVLRMVTFVNNNKYSDLALDFPLLEKNEWVKCHKPFLYRYPGRKWWQGMNSWISNLVYYYCEKIEYPQLDISKSYKKPFAMELCGWHSAKWDSNQFLKAFQYLEVRKYVIKRFIRPLLFAIDKSEIKLAVCIGKAIGKLFENVICFNDETHRLFNSLKYTKLRNISIAYDGDSKSKSYKNLIVEYYFVYKKSKEKKSTRYYGVFSQNKRYIINTWIVGSNRHPSNSYREFEQVLIKTINELRYGKILKI